VDEDQLEKDLQDGSNIAGNNWSHATEYQSRLSRNSKINEIDLFLNNQPDALIIQIYCYKILHVSGIFSVHHQEFSTVHSALVGFKQVFDDRFQAESRWN
jgi:hypothetical protein